MKPTKLMYTYMLTHGFKHTKLQHSWSNGINFDLDDDTLIHMPAKRKSRAAAATPINEQTVVPLGELNALMWALGETDIEAALQNYAKMLDHSGDPKRAEAIGILIDLVAHIKST